MSDLVARGANPQTIRFQHDFNDRERDGSYRIWLQPGTRVTLYDGEGIEIECFLEYSQFVTVVPAPRGDADA